MSQSQHTAFPFVPSVTRYFSTVPKNS
jgi:hypothetical protein